MDEDDSLESQFIDLLIASDSVAGWLDAISSQKTPISR